MSYTMSSPQGPDLPYHEGGAELDHFMAVRAGEVADELLQDLESEAHEIEDGKHTLGEFQLTEADVDDTHEERI